MWRGAQQPLTFAERFTHQRDAPLLEVPHAAVDQARAAHAGPVGEVAGVDEHGARTAERGLACDRGPLDSTTDHEHVELSTVDRDRIRAHAWKISTDSARPHGGFP